MLCSSCSMGKGAHNVLPAYFLSFDRETQALSDMRQVAKFEMRGPEYVPKKKPKKSKKLASKVDKALSWGGFDDQAKATEVRSAWLLITGQMLPTAQHSMLAWAAASTNSRAWTALLLAYCP